MHMDKWLTCGVSVIGSSHAAHGLPNQDAWLGHSIDGFNVLAVSDGVGSCAHAEHGSKAACRAVLAAARAFRRKTVTSQSLPGYIHNIWLEYVRPYEPDDCAATCLFAVRAGDRLLVGRLGDGFIAVCSRSGLNDYLLKDNKEHSFVNLTDSLWSGSCKWEIKLLHARLYDNIIICTDGLPFEGSESRFAKDMRGQYAGMDPKAREKDIKSWLECLNRPDCRDDKTVACLFRKGVRASQ